MLEMIFALHPPCSFARGLDGRQQQRDEDANDGDHDQKFNERKRPAFDASHNTPCPSKVEIRVTPAATTISQQKGVEYHLFRKW